MNRDHETRPVQVPGAGACATTFSNPVSADAVWRRLAVVLFLIAASAAAAALPQLHELLLYDRGAIARGQVWRLFTGHLAHWSASHLAWNLVSLGAVGWGARDLPFRLVSRPVSWSILLIGPVLFLCQAGMAQYTGLSGVVTALFVCLAGERMRSAPDERWVWGALLVAMCGKIAVEFAQPTPLFAASGAPSFRASPMAHLVGAVVGWFALAPPRRLSLRAPLESARHVPS